jgi:hypothetical protein
VGCSWHIPRALRSSSVRVTVPSSSERLPRPADSAVRRWAVGVLLGERGPFLGPGSTSKKICVCPQCFQEEKAAVFIGPTLQGRSRGASRFRVSEPGVGGSEAGQGPCAQKEAGWQFSGEAREPLTTESFQHKSLLFLQTCSNRWTLGLALFWALLLPGCVTMGKSLVLSGSLSPTQSLLPWTVFAGSGGLALRWQRR